MLTVHTSVFIHQSFIINCGDRRVRKRRRYAPRRLEACSMHDVCTPQEAIDTAVAAGLTGEAEVIIEQAESVEELED